MISRLNHRAANFLFVSTEISNSYVIAFSAAGQSEPIRPELSSRFRVIITASTHERYYASSISMMRQNCLFRNSEHYSEIEKFGCVLHNFSSRPGKRPGASRGMLVPKRPPSSPASV